MHAENSKLKNIYVLPDEIKNIVSQTVGGSDVGESLTVKMKQNVSLRYDIYNYTEKKARLVGQDGLELAVDPMHRPIGFEPGIVIKSTITTQKQISEIDPRAATNNPTNEFEQMVGNELRKAREISSNRLNASSRPGVKMEIMHFINVEMFKNTDTIYDSKTNYLISIDQDRSLIHPNNAKLKDIREQLGMAEELAPGDVQVKYVLIDNSAMHSKLYLNVGHGVLCVKSKIDHNRESGLYVYTKGDVSKGTFMQDRPSVVKFDIETILSEKLFAFPSMTEAVAAGSLDDRLKEFEKRSQYKSAQDERMYKNMEANGKREDRMREDNHKKLMDTIKLATGVVSFLGAIAAIYSKTKTKKG